MISTAFRQRMKRVPMLHRVWRLGYESINRTDLSLLDSLVTFAPNSAGTLRQRSTLALLDASHFFDLSNEVLTASGAELLPIEIAEDFAENDAEREASRVLATGFAKYGSDKSTGHDYHNVYGPILARQGTVRAILEVGLGTNNTDTVSNMGARGMPGASLRAFRDHCASAKIYGADIDRRVLFSENGIETFFVDQTKMETFDILGEKISSKLDLIIDDGLHSPSANLTVLRFGMQHVSEDGWIVIEDIGKQAVPCWQLIAAAIGRHWKCRIISARGGYMFVVRRVM